MNAQTQSLTVHGPVGPIDVLEDRPESDLFERPHGSVVIAHPHPLFGGTMRNKVVQTLARAFVQSGWRALRFNFRGVEGSAGQHDHGHGEQDDLLAVVEQAVDAEAPLALAGFSFGGFVAANAASALWPRRPLAKLVLVGLAASRFEVRPLPPELHERSLLIHGEQDDTVPLAAVLDWARPQSLPIMVVPGGEHFFHGQLPLLKSLVLRHVRS